MENTNIYTKLFEIKKVWIKLQRDTQAFNYKYATLSQIQEKLSWEFEKYKLLIFHSINNNQVTTCIKDIEFWECLESSIPMSEWTKPQDKWSEITYYRRYNLLSLLDLEVEDDDWKSAQDSKSQVKKDFYNDTEKHIDKWRDMVADWKTTWKEILAKVTNNWEKLIKGTDKEMILALDK